MHVVSCMFVAGCKAAALALCALAFNAQACPGAQTQPGRNEASIGQPWPDSRFVYAFSPEVAADSARVSAFEHACSRLLETTALRCTPRSRVPEAPDYVYVIDGGHDFSWVGRQGGCQVLSILTWNNPMVIAHEIKHALGWAHEQQHPERDQYITVDLAAVPEPYRAEFQVRDLGNEGPYDFDSIMHFYPSDFARPGTVAFRPRPEFAGEAGHVGQRDHLSQTDLLEIRAVYGAAEGE
ncbi:MAG: M12 family metallopeptidase [Lysobacterales bacterium]